MTFKSSLFLLVSLYLVGCKTSTVTHEKHKMEMEIAHKKLHAKDLYYDGQFAKALNVFLELDSIQPNTPDNTYHIGICYIQLEHDEAIYYLEKCIANPELYPEELNYFMAAAYHLNHKFDKAIHHYELYKAHLYTKKGVQKDYKLINEVNREIQMCEVGAELVKNKLDIEIHNLSDQINSPYPDYAPVLSADEKVIIFTSERDNSTGGHQDKQDGTFNEDMYTSEKDEQGNWGPPRKLNINTEGQDASVALSPDGHSLLIYHYNNEHFLARHSGDLYLAKMSADTFLEPEILHGHINSPFWESGASMSADGNMIYFSSNRKGSIGGTDIYSVKKLPNGDWAEPVNLGVNINTGHDEESPFIHPDGKTLYFSSDGHHSMGGYDIFFSEWDNVNQEWAHPKNLGYPINTAHDDIHFSLSADGTRIYFSSVRDDTRGDKDIYYATIKEDKHKLLVLKGFVLDSVTNKPVPASITVRDQETKELLGIYNSNSKTGKYIVIFMEDKKYDITIEAEGYELCSDSIDNYGLSDFEEREQDIILCPNIVKQE